MKRQPARVRRRQAVRAAAAVGLLLVVAVLMAVIPVRPGGIDFTRAPAATDAVSTRSFRDTRWYELGPKDWDPFKEVRELQRQAKAIPDSDVRAVAMLKRTREIWDNAPVNPALDGKAIRIPGYVVPLDQAGGGLKEFLLVPYFGACIHTPPPPSNQIIRVTMNNAVTGLHTMDTLWVSGVLHAARTDSSMGASSYTLEASNTERYTPAR